MSGDRWVGLQVTGLFGSLSGPHLSASVTGATVQLNEASDPSTGAIDWTKIAGSGVALTSAIASVAGTISGLNAFDLVTGGASFSVTRVYVSADAPVLTDVPLLYGSLTIGGGQHLLLGSRALGIDLVGGIIKFASVDDNLTSGKSWFGLEATGLVGTFAGPGIQGSVAGGTVKINEGSLDAVHPTLVDENTDADPIDWTQSTLAVTGLDLSGSLAEVSGDVTGLDVFGLIHGDATFDVTRTLVTTAAPNPVLADAPLLVGTVTVSGGGQLRLGTAGLGVTITGGTLKVATLTDPGTSGYSWLAVDAELLSGSLAGPGLQADVANGSIKLNTGSTGAGVLDWTGTGLEDAGLGLSGVVAKVSADIDNLDLFGFVKGGASFSVSRTLVTTSAPNPAFTDAPLVTGSFSIDATKGQRLVVGSPSLGLILTAGTLHVAVLSDPGTSGQSWFGLDGDGIAGILIAPSLQATLSNGAVRFNGGPTGLDPLDWRQSGLGGAGLALSGHVAHISGDITNLNAFGIVTGGIGFSVDRTYVTTVAPNPPMTRAVLLAGTLILDSSKTEQLNLGTSAFGLQVTQGTVYLASLTDPGGTNSWFGFAASQLGATLSGPQIHATVTDGLIELNQGSPNAVQALDWSQSGLEGAGLSLTSRGARIAGDVSDINALGVVSGAASFSVSWSLVTTTNPALTDASLLTGSFSVNGDPNHTNQQLVIGTSSFGITINGGQINIASLTAPAPPPSTGPQVNAPVFVPGPRVDVVTTVQGGKAATVRTLSDGDATHGKTEILTIKASSGSFTVAGGSTDTPATLDWNAAATDATNSTLTVQGAIARLATIQALATGKPCAATGCVTVAPMMVQPEGNIYWITFDPSLGTGAGVPLLSANGTNLVARNEQQKISVWNANGGSFTLSDGTHSATVPFDLSNLAGALANSSLGSDVKIAGDPPGLPPNNGFFTVEFNGAAVAGRHPNALAASVAQLTGALDNGQLVGDANFGATIFSNPTDPAVITKQGVATVTPSNYVLGGPATNAVQLVRVDGAVGGYFQLSYVYGLEPDLAVRHRRRG
ncbi:MAG: hypothetical protein E6J28_13130 [Chloroflexi bacterium]|nr:MAG: hypothetical protein E6J28_13130 [Chloroflexota bacterium]